MCNHEEEHGKVYLRQALYLSASRPFVRMPRVITLVQGCGYLTLTVYL